MGMTHHLVFVSSSERKSGDKVCLYICMSCLLGLKWCSYCILAVDCNSIGLIKFQHFSFCLSEYSNNNNHLVPQGGVILGSIHAIGHYQILNFCKILEQGLLV